MTTRSRLAKLNHCRRPRRPRTRRTVKIPGRATSMRTFKRMPGTGRRSVSSVTLRRICGRATAPPPTTRRAVRRRRPSSGALKARLSAPSPDDRLRRPRERDTPDAAGHQTRQEQQREQQAKTPAPAGVTVAAQKVAAPAAVEAGHAIPPDAAVEAVTPAKTPGAPREEEPDKLMKNLASSCKKQTGEQQWTPLQNRRDARRCSRPQEAERQTPPHPPGAHVWPAVLLPRPASGQEKQEIAR